MKRDKIEKLWPLMAAETKQANDIRKFEEIGTHSAAPRLAIGEALLFHNGIGGKRKEARLRYLSRYWMNRLKDVPKVSFNTSFDPNQSCAIANVNIAGIDPTAHWQLSLQQASSFHDADRPRRIQGHSHHAERLHHPRRARPLLQPDGVDCPERPSGLIRNTVRVIRGLIVLECLRLEVHTGYMEVLLAEEFGFCFGVERAVEMVEEAVEEGVRPIRSLGPLIHNAQEMERLGPKAFRRSIHPKRLTPTRSP